MSTYQSWKLLFAFLLCFAATTVTAFAEPLPKRSSHGSADYAIQVLGQDAAGKPSFFSKMKTGFTNFFKDDSDDPHGHHDSGGQQRNSSDSGKGSQASPSRATRVTPPKPVTIDAAAETTSTRPQPTETAATPRKPASNNEIAPPPTTASPTQESRARNEVPRQETVRTATVPREQHATVYPEERQDSGDDLIQNRMERLRRMREKTATSRKSPEEVNREAMEQLSHLHTEQQATERSTASPPPAARRTPTQPNTPADSVATELWENLEPAPARHQPQPLYEQENANEFLRSRTVAEQPSRLPADSMTLTERMEWARSQPRQRPVHEESLANEVPAQTRPHSETREPLAGQDAWRHADELARNDNRRAAHPMNRESAPDAAPVAETAPFATESADRLAMRKTTGRPLAVESTNHAGPSAGRIDVIHAPSRAAAASSNDRTSRTAVSRDASRQSAAMRRPAQESEPRESASPSTSFSGTSERFSVDVADDKEKSLLVSPLLEVETIGPQRVIVGQESPYQIRLCNRGGVTAEQVVLHVDLPAWIDILPPEVSAGGTSVSSTTPQGTPTQETTMVDGAKTFHWKIDRIDPQSEEQLILHLVPKERKSFNLKLHYDFKRVSAVAPVEVQEPKLEMAIDGPNEILWGNEEIYKLRIRNTGNGDAEKIRLALLPGNVEGQGSEETCTLDLLKAGEEITIDVRAKALQNDFLDINVVANGPFDLQARTMRRVNVLRAELDLVIESPELLFVGSRAEYILRVRNIGNAPSGPVELLALVPLGANYISNTGGGRSTPQKEVIWNIDSIPVAGEFTASVVCELKRQGVTKLEVSVDDGTGLVAAMQGLTQVESIADLKMKIENPQGPVEVGSEAVYTILITNNGTRAAEGVDIDAMFSNDIDPVGFEGLAGEITGNGHVLFERIPSISPGQTLKLKVRAKASQAGNHKIRVELACDSTGLQLVHEESTYYYIRRGNKYAASSKPTATAMLTAQPLPLPPGSGTSDTPIGGSTATNPVPGEPNKGPVETNPAPSGPEDMPAPFAAEPMPLPSW